jgi:hypothetical protein
MFSGPPLPLPPHMPLCQLFALAQAPGTLGAWVRTGARSLHMYEIAGHCRRILVGRDLGLLLAHCNRVALREGDQPVVLEADLLIQWRALQVATATPFLPGLERLRGVFPDLQVTMGTVVVPLATRTPEEVLARCVAEELPVKGSHLLYSPTTEIVPRSELVRLT